MKQKLNPWNVIGKILIAAALFTVALPFLWVALASFKSGQQLNNPTLITFKPNLENWKIVFNSGIIQSAGRSAVVGLITVLISVVFGSMGAYSISRYKTGKSLTRFGILAAQVLPPCNPRLPLSRSLISTSSK